jgi:hypothetical protein
MARETSWVFRRRGPAQNSWTNLGSAQTNRKSEVSIDKFHKINDVGQRNIRLLERCYRNHVPTVKKTHEFDHGSTRNRKQLTPVSSVLHRRGKQCSDSQVNKVVSSQSEAPQHSTTACVIVAAACVIVAIWRLKAVCAKILPTREKRHTHTAR